MSEKLDGVISRIKDENIKVVSFDIFDTLLVRPVVQPVDLFRLVAKRWGYSEVVFTEQRRNAEAEARRQKPFNVDDVTLDEIYQKYAELYSVTKEVAEKIKQTEMDIEYKFLRPRKSLRKVFYEAKNAGKEVIITSDMYLPIDFLEKVLVKCGYRNYDKLYLSCEYGMSKGSGRLYKKIISDYKEKEIMACQILHIGDNYSADVQQAKNAGIKAAHVPSAISVFKSKRLLKETLELHNNRLDDTFITGYLANYLFDDPFEEYASYSVIDGRYQLLGPVLIAPLMLSFTKWLIEDCIEEEVDKLLFVYRDGYLPELIYEKLKPYYNIQLKTDKIYLSRAIRYNYFVKEKDGFLKGLLDLPVNKGMLVSEFIENRLLITKESEKQEAVRIFAKYGFSSQSNKIGEIIKNAKLLKELEPFYIKNAEKNIKIIDEYCQSKLEKNQKIAIFDVGYRGSVQRFIKKEFQKETIGYHLFAQPLINQGRARQLKSYVYYGFSVIKDTMILHALIEDIISSSEGSAIGITKDENDFQILRENNEPKKVMTEIQDSIINFIDGFVTLFEEEICTLEFDHYSYFELLVKFLQRPCQKDAQVIRNLKFVDSSLITNSENNIYEKWYQKYFPTASGTIKASKSKIKIETYNLLDKYHLLPYAKKVQNKTRELYKKVQWKKQEEYEKKITMEEEKNSSIEFLREQEFLKKTKNIVVCGDMVSYDKGVCNYLNRLSQNLKEYNFILLSEATWVREEVMKKKIEFASFYVPPFLGKNRYEMCKTETVTAIMKKRIEEKTYLQWAISNFKKCYSNLGSGYAEAWAYYAEKYYEEVFELLKPEQVLLWNEFHALHHIVRAVASKKGIKIKYMEFGSIPGTFALENMGQMGESYPARYYKEFRKKPVEKNELDYSREILNELRESKLNRNIQKQGDMELLKKQIKKGRPVLFYAGQNDFESGIFPYTENSKKYHSPIFSSSDETAVYLAKLAKKNDWNLIYKPHPIMKSLGNVGKKFPENVIVVNEYDINELIDFSDVVLTILSQTAYISLIRQKPTVMLGFNQLRGKGCTYEAFEREKIEEMITEAVKSGYTDTMKKEFELHVAQMLKYCLYDDLLRREKRYGLPIAEALKEF